MRQGGNDSCFEDELVALSRALCDRRRDFAEREEPETRYNVAQRALLGTGSLAVTDETEPGEGDIALVLSSGLRARFATICARFGYVAS